MKDTEVSETPAFTALPEGNEYEHLTSLKGKVRYAWQEVGTTRELVLGIELTANEWVRLEPRTGSYEELHGLAGQILQFTGTLAGGVFTYDRWYVMGASTI